MCLKHSVIRGFLCLRGLRLSVEGYLDKRDTIFAAVGSNTVVTKYTQFQFSSIPVTYNLGEEVVANMR